MGDLSTKTPEEISKMTPKELENALPEGWTYAQSPNGDFVHIKDADAYYSTGRTEPNNILEQMAMEQAKIDPLSQGKVIIDELGDIRWKGWQKWQISYPTSDGNITIHFNYDPIRGLFDDFKFVNP